MSGTRSASYFGVFWTGGILAWICWLTYLNLKTRSWKLSWKSDGFSRYFGFWVISDFNCGFSCACFIADLENSAIQHCLTGYPALSMPSTVKTQIMNFLALLCTWFKYWPQYRGLACRAWRLWIEENMGTVAPALFRLVMTYCVWKYTCVCSLCHVCGGQKTAQKSCSFYLV